MSDTGPDAPIGGPGMPPGELLDAVPAMIWLADADRRRVWFNEAWLAFTGLDLERALGDGWTESVHPDDAGPCLEDYAARIAAREPFRLQYRLRHRDGGHRWIEDSGVPRHAEDGSFLGYVGACSDVDEHVAAEIELARLRDELERQVGETTNRLQTALAVQSQVQQELQQSSIELDFLIQALRDCAIYMLDSEGRVTSWNVGAARIKGYMAEEVLGQHFSCFYTEEDLAAGQPEETLRKAREEGRAELEAWRMRKDGTGFWASVLVNPIHADDGRLLGFAKLTRDITDRHLAEAQLESTREKMMQMQKMEAIGQLTGGVAHDFNNLLTVIIGNLETIARNLPSDEGTSLRLKRAIDNAGQGAQRAATLTQRLLAFARRQPLEPRPLNLNQFIAGEVEFLQRSLGEQISVEAVGGGGLWPVEADPSQLQTALLNLAINARDAMPDGGTLTIETSNAYLDAEYCRSNPEVRPGQYVLISVTDSGVGMSPEVIEHAFEPFFSTKSVGQGTGLGLSQIYGFIKQSGGHVKIYSEVGEGTTVRIYLPRLMGDVPVDHGQDRELPVPGEASETILVVEDDDDVRSYLFDVLRELGYSVLRADGAAAAFEHLERPDTHIDLLLTDVVLPGMNGREIANRARELRPDLKVLFMTGYSRNAIVHQGRLEPGVELLQKPITQDQLASRIRGLLDLGPTTEER